MVSRVAYEKNESYCGHPAKHRLLCRGSLSNEKSRSTNQGSARPDSSYYVDIFSCCQKVLGTTSSFKISQYTVFCYHWSWSKLRWFTFSDVLWCSGVLWSIIYTVSLYFGPVPLPIPWCSSEKKKLLRTSLGKRHSWRPRQRCTMPKPKRTRPWDSNDSICAACGAISLPMLQTATVYILYSHVFLAEIWEVTYHLHVWHGISWHLVFSQPQMWPKDCCLTLYVDLGLMDVDGGEGRERRREWRW